jgi:hypothetical protein
MDAGFFAVKYSMQVILPANTKQNVVYAFTSATNIAPPPCARFCAYQQTLPLATDYDASRPNPLPC